jgi:hypothetical protein
MCVLQHPLYGRAYLNQKPHLQTVESTTARKIHLHALPAKGMTWRYAKALCLYSVTEALFEDLCSVWRIQVNVI